MSTTLIAIGLLILACFVCLFIINRMIGMKFPIVNFDVGYKGIRTRQKYRLFGDIVVADDVFGLLIGNHTICGGSIRDYEMYKTTKMANVYLANLHKRFLVAVKTIDKQVDVVPEAYINLVEGEGDNKKKIKIRTSNQGFLLPLKIKSVCDEAMEVEISNAVSICNRYKESVKSTEDLVKSQNPLYNIILISVPTIIMVLSFTALIIIAINGIQENVTTGVVAADKIHQDNIEMMRLLVELYNATLTS